MGKIDAVTPRGKKEGPGASSLVSGRLLWKDWGSRIPVHPPGLSCCRRQIPSPHPPRSEIALFESSCCFFHLYYSPEPRIRRLVRANARDGVCVSRVVCRVPQSRLRDPVLYKARFWGAKACSRVIWLIPAITS